MVAMKMNDNEDSDAGMSNDNLGDSPSLYDENVTNESKTEAGIVNVDDTVTRNPAMARVQNALKAQLAKTIDRIQREFQEEQDGYQKVKKEREDVGVELYGMQQQLAQLQSKFDGSGEQHADLMSNRQRAEENFVDLRIIVKDKTSKQSELNKKSSKRQEELDEADSNLKQAEQFNAETTNEVALTKRAASKAEEVVKEAEKGKDSQDIYIDGLNQQIKHLTAGSKLATQQLGIQKHQTDETDKVIKELTLEVEVLSSDKKQLVQQWNSAILALGRRDQALGAVANAVKEAHHNSKDHNNEITGLGKESFSLSLETEKIKFDRNKIENEINLIVESMVKSKSDQEILASQQELISKIITNTQEDEKREERKVKRYLSDLAASAHKIDSISRERRDLEDQIGSYRGERTTISQAMINLIKQDKILANKIHEKDIESGSVENDLARVKIDILNTNVHCSQLKDKLDDETAIVEDKNKLIATEESAIKRTHDDIGSKMNKVDRLNRKYEQMLDGVEEEEPLGPLEATIKSTEKAVAIMDDDTRSLQTDWASKQTKLICTINATEKLEEEKRQKGAKLTILKQKRLRLLQDIHSNEATLKVIRSRIKGMHTDMSRLNELIGRYSLTQTKLENENAVRQMEFSKEIIELGQKSSDIEVRTATVKAAKEELVKKIIDAEREILLWEKKIQLEKETQAALNSSEHANEIKGMEKEIHRMQHKLEQMKRQQENMIREMEFAINKREDIAVKYQNNKHGNAITSVTTTKANARKRKAEIKLSHRGHKTEKAKILSEQKELKQNYGMTSQKIASIKIEVQTEIESNKKLQSDINNMFFEKQRLLSKFNYLQELLTKFQSLQENDVLDHQTEQFSIQKRMASVKARMSKLHNAIAGLRIKYAQYDDVFDRVNILVIDIEKEHA